LRVLRIAAIAAFGLALPVSVAAQDFGVMQSAETVKKGNFKLAANPIIVFGKNGGDGETGVSARAGYGFGDAFDVEAKIAKFEDFTLFGADAEYWFAKDKTVDMSVIGGFNIGNGDGFGTKALELTFLASGKVKDRLELYGGLDMSRISIDDADFSYTTWHLVPGLEYRLGSQMDLVGEFGVALNKDAQHYLSFAFVYYTRGR
jgi:hypothetical protein